jgi:hypothetical protein
VALDKEPSFYPHAACPVQMSDCHIDLIQENYENRWACCTTGLKIEDVV